MRKLHNPVTKFVLVYRCISLQYCLGEKPGQKAVVEKQARNGSTAIKAVTGQPKTKKSDSKLRQTRTEDTAKYIFDITQFAASYKRLVGTLNKLGSHAKKMPVAVFHNKFLKYSFKHCSYA